MGSSIAGTRTSTGIPRQFQSLAELIGNTPLLTITFLYKKTVRTLYAKAEHLNLTGSIKDRMALHILRHAYEQGRVHAGDTIVEATSGNTGIAFAALGRALGHSVVIYMPDWMSHERVKLIESYGAQIVPVSRTAGGFLGSIRMAEDHGKNGCPVFLPQQFENLANLEAHALTTGPEMLKQLARINLIPDAFVAGVGTGGTIMGISAYLRQLELKTRVYPVEPAESPTLSTGYKSGSHRIQGISDEFIPNILQLSSLDKVLSISDGDSILMAQKLTSTLGLAVGISSGCNFLAAVTAQEILGRDAVVSTVFSDDNRKYLSTDLLKTEPVRDGYLTPYIELLEFQVVGRL